MEFRLARGRLLDREPSEFAGALANMSLSPREQEIARLVAIGYPNKTIAGILDISPWTVATHVRRIFNKLGVHGRPAMIAELARAGFRFDRALPASARRLKPPPPCPPPM
jgi:DNA-binding CsgD family transcriptional regulator